jgi:[ribosomal protein S18]-alanine N-acetyltransferase
LWDLVVLAPSATDQILSIERQSFKRAWHRESFLGEFSRADSFNYGVKFKNALAAEPIIAYICYRIFLDEMHLLKIAVSPEWRSQGIGEWLLSECMEKGKRKGAIRILLEVRPSNRSAIAMYDKMGFHTVGRRPRYYPDTREDALVMARDL